MSETLQENKKALMHILDQFDTAMLVTQVVDDFELRARPMRLLEVSDGAEEIMFVTDMGDQKVDEILRHPYVAITMQDGTQTVSISGNAHVSQNTDEINGLWEKYQLEKWIDGATSEAAAIIKVRPTKGEYWNMTATASLKAMAQKAFSLFSDNLSGEAIHGNKEVDFKSA